MTDPATAARKLRTRPWTVSIEGEVDKPRVVDIDELLRSFPLEERVYRMRCVEGWSMVIPWVGFPLGALLKRFEPDVLALLLLARLLVRRGAQPRPTPDSGRAERP